MATIRYAQCWEDPETLRKALDVTTEDDVVSIASGGDNTFALLLDNPRSVTAVDANPLQIFLVELKLRAIQHLDYDDFAGFVGARPCGVRTQLYQRLRQTLSPEAGQYWDEHPGIIRRGIIHCGKFERYFAVFRQIVMPLVHRSSAIFRLLSADSLEEQQRFHDHVWNNRRWRWLFQVFFGKLLLGRLGRDPSLFRYVKDGNIGDILLDRVRRGLTQVPIRDNYFVEYILTGRYWNLEIAHPYLRAANFQVLKERIDRIQIVCSSLEDHLKTLRPGAISKFNLSDVFEYMSEEEMTRNLRQIHRVSRDQATLAFWTLFVPRDIPSGLKGQFESDRSASDKLQSTERAFFYENFCIWHVCHQAVPICVS